MNNSWGNPAEVIVAFLAVIGTLGALGAWIYQRGDREGATVKALNDNTSAIRDLSGDFRDFKGETLATLLDYGWRLTILEDKTKAYEGD